MLRQAENFLAISILYPLVLSPVEGLRETFTIACLGFKPLNRYAPFKPLESPRRFERLECFERLEQMFSFESFQIDRQRVQILVRQHAEGRHDNSGFHVVGPCDPARKRL